MKEETATNPHDTATNKQMPKVRIHIDQNPYESPNPTTGEALYTLGKVPAHHELFQEVDGNSEDTVIPRDFSQVHLQKDEHFHSGPREITILVNGQKKVVAARRLSFANVVALAFNPVPTGPNVLITVTYRKGPHSHSEGTLRAGEAVRIKEGMVFNATATDKS